MRHLIVGLGLAGLLAGCITAPPAIKPSESYIDLSLSTLDPRPVVLHIKGPASLGAGGTIISDAGAGVIAAGAGNVIAAGAGNLVSPASIRFRLSAASESYAPVAKATLQLQTLDGIAVGRVVTSDDQGVITLQHVDDDRPLSAVATFVIKDKTYQVAALIPTERFDKPVPVDPINAMVDARVKIVSGRIANLQTLSFEKLARIHSICDQAGVSVEAEALVAGQALDVLDKVWEREIKAKVTKADEKQTITDFIGAIKADVAP